MEGGCFCCRSHPAQYLLDRRGRNGVDRIAFHRRIAPVERHLHPVLAHRL